jgi:hypothetical protein
MSLLPTDARKLLAEVAKAWLCTRTDRQERFSNLRSDHGSLPVIISMMTQPMLHTSTLLQTSKSIWRELRGDETETTTLLTRRSCRATPQEQSAP